MVIVCLVRELEIDKMGWQIFKLSAEFRASALQNKKTFARKRTTHVSKIEKLLKIGGGCVEMSED